MSIGDFVYKYIYMCMGVTICDMFFPHQCKNPSVMAMGV